MKFEEVLPALRAGKTITMTIDSTQFLYRLGKNGIQRCSIHQNQQTTWSDCNDSWDRAITYDWNIYIPSFSFFTAIEKMKHGKEVYWAESTGVHDRFFIKDGFIYKRCIGDILQKGPAMMTGAMYLEYIPPPEGPRF